MSGGGDNDSKKRNLPSWISRTNNSATPTSTTTTKTEQPKDFSRLMEGLVFVLSGFVNPERATLRSQAMEMGAEYRPDWASDCTLLVCAYSNTPKFRQVEADSGTVVKKEWIEECYKQKKLVEIDSYLMHAGKPWRKFNSAPESSGGQHASLPKKTKKQVEKVSQAKQTTSSSSKRSRVLSHSISHFSVDQVKEWPIEDLNRTISWLDIQEEKPEPSEIKQVASQGIVICLQDTIDALEQDQDARQVTDQWNVIPRAVEELLKLSDAHSLSKDELCRHAMECKRMYEEAFSVLQNDSNTEKKQMKNDKNETVQDEKHTSGCDSAETIEMTEEEIELAYSNVVSKIS